MSTGNKRLGFSSTLILTVLFNITLYILISDRIKISPMISEYSYITGRLGFCEALHLISLPFALLHFTILSFTSIYHFVLQFPSPRLTKHRSISVSFIPFGFNSPHFTSVYLHSIHFPFIYFNPLRVTLFLFVLFYFTYFTSPYFLISSA